MIAEVSELFELATPKARSDGRSTYPPIGGLSGFGAVSTCLELEECSLKERLLLEVAFPARYFDEKLSE